MLGFFKKSFIPTGLTAIKPILQSGNVFRSKAMLVRDPVAQM
jgi:hypothetical protein